MYWGIGEIGLNKNTRNEATVFLEHLELAVKHHNRFDSHHPPWKIKFQGTRLILDMLEDVTDRSQSSAGRSRRRAYHW